MEDINIVAVVDGAILVWEARRQDFRISVCIDGAVGERDKMMTV